MKLDIRNHIKIQSLSQEQSNNLEGLITRQEVLSALKHTKNDKSPGSDGYTVEFFKCFFVDLGNFIVRSINCGFSKGKMSATQRQGVITCIPEEGKDKTLLRNWRLITLLNIAYKIASSCIVGRLKDYYRS